MQRKFINHKGNNLKRDQLQAGTRVMKRKTAGQNDQSKITNGENDDSTDDSDASNDKVAVNNNKKKRSIQGPSKQTQPAPKITRKGAGSSKPAATASVTKRQKVRHNVTENAPVTQVFIDTRRVLASKSLTQASSLVSGNRLKTRRSSFKLGACRHIEPHRTPTTTIRNQKI